MTSFGDDVQVFHRVVAVAEHEGVEPEFEGDLGELIHPLVDRADEESFGRRLELLGDEVVDPTNRRSRPAGSLQLVIQLIDFEHDQLGIDAEHARDPAVRGLGDEPAHARLRRADPDVESRSTARAARSLQSIR